jgi:hypothetical protein
MSGLDFVGGLLCGMIVALTAGFALAVVRVRDELERERELTDEAWRRGYERGWGDRGSLSRE